MPTVRLTNAVIPKLPLPTKGRGNQVLYQDEAQPGLAVRVTQGGARSFVVDRKTERGRIRITLGPCESMTVFNARLRAADVVGQIGKGATAAQIKVTMARDDGAVEPGAVTCGAVLDEYLKMKRSLAPRTAYDYRRLFGLLPEKDKPDPRGPSGPLADWRKVPIASITMNDVKEKFLSIGAPSAANYSMRLMRALFNYAATMTRDDGSPVSPRTRSRS